MPEDLETGLATLADHGSRTGRLAAAATVRTRADRRRRRRQVATAAFAVVVAGAFGASIAAAQPQQRTSGAGLLPGSAPAGTVPSAAPSPVLSAAPTSRPPSARPSSGAPSRSASRSPSRPPLAGDVLSGDREVFFFLLDDGEEVPETVLGVTREERVDVTADYGVRSLFVPVPGSRDGNEYAIRTARLRSGGEAFCWQVRDGGSGPGTIVAAACDAGDLAQRFTLAERGEDNQGRMTYAIRNGENAVVYDPRGDGDGLVVRAPGEQMPDTTYVLIDRGAAELPVD